MSSKVGRFFYLAINFILGAFFLLEGAYSLLLPWSSFIRDKTIFFILNHHMILSVFGLGLVITGLSILIQSIVSSKRKYLYVQTGLYSIQIDETLIQQYLKTYWKERFPGYTIFSHLKIKKNAIYITADLPPIHQEEEMLLINQIKEDFADIFNRLLGYPHEIHLALSFDHH
jgi:hypothetical protein